MKLLVNELYESLSQSVTPLKNTNVEAIRVHLYKHNVPDGQLSIEIHDNNDRVIYASEIIEISDISAASFFHGQVRFYIKAQLQKDQEYKMVLKASDYSFNESAYVGWCYDFDFKTYDTSYIRNGIVNNPMDYEIWEIR